MPTPVNPPPPPPPDETTNLDTGTGGFPVVDQVSGRAIRHAYDVSEIGMGIGDDGSPPVDWSPGKINVDDRPKDLSRKTKSTLAAYMSDSTLGRISSLPAGARNKYPINQADGNDPRDLTLTDKDGYVTSPTSGNDVYNYGFLKTDEKANVKSRSSVGDTNLKGLTRGKSKPTLKDSVDGHTLLKDFTPLKPAASAIGGAFTPPMGKVNLKDKDDNYTSESAKVIDTYYGNVITSKENPGNPNVSNSVIYNRFNPENTFESLSGGNGSNLSNAQFAKQYTKGTSVADRDITFGRLAQIGNALSIRAGLELNSLNQGNNPTDEQSQLGALLPGTTQLGVYRLERDQLTAESVLQDLTSEGIGTELLIDPAAQSWGTLNNVQDQFSGISNFGMQLLAVALLVALSVVVVAMSAIFSIGSAELPTVITKDDLGRPVFGAWKLDKTRGDYGGVASIVAQIVSGNFNLWRLLGLSPTNNPMSKCLPVGALAFFGVDEPGASVASMASVAVAKGALSVTQSPGYYSVMARSVNRSFLQIGDSFSSLAKAFATGNITAGVKQLFGIIDVLKSSKFIRAVDVFSQIGDRQLGDPAYPTSKDDASLGSGARFKTRLNVAQDGMSVDNYIGSEHHLAGASRVSQEGSVVGATTLSWSSYRAPDQLLRSKEFLNVIQPSGPVGRKPTVKEGKGGIRSGGIYKAEDSRISTEDREKFENALDSEYVPFYIHDIRTNEIVSFHAFLASLSDDYSAAYDTVEAFGRVEPIKTYKSTTRKIGFSFYLASTSHEDFDSMWLKINKLTTMVYPQFNKGRVLERDNYRITVPFSQTMQASPMVRLRIGDLIQSNYSKFNLSRLFGYGNSDTMFDGKKSPAISLQENDTEIMERFEKGATDVRVIFKNSNEELPIWMGLGNPDKIVKDFNKSGLVLKVNLEQNDGYCLCEIEKAVGEDLIEVKNSDKYNSVIGELYKIPKNLLKPSKSGVSKIKSDILSERAPEYTRAVDDFMSEAIEKSSTSGNAIVRSFRSSGGKGLAGFIESMNFDWFDRVTWETEEAGRKAPRMCKVTVSFSPIHDITPGLDHTGMNRAPIYPVAQITGNTKKGR